MCGFVGLVSSKKISNEQYFNLDIASKEIDFRGPDHVGKWTDPQKNIAIIHNRLSILDITQKRQPTNAIYQ